MSQRDLDLYDRYFTVVPADTPELLDAAHELRYQVYCREHAFENPAADSGGSACPSSSSTGSSSTTASDAPWRTSTTSIAPAGRE